MPELILKERIYKLINELIRSIELRIKLNEAIVDMKEITLQTKRGNTIKRREANSLMEENVNQVLEECEETLEKLNLLKVNLADMTEPELLYLFNNYSKFSLKEFKENLNTRFALSE